MAVLSAVFSLSAEAATTASLNTVTSTAAITIGADRKFIVRATGDFNLKMGTSSLSAATASDFQFGGATTGANVYTLSTGPNCTSIRIFNPGGSSITYWLQPLAD